MARKKTGLHHLKCDSPFFPVDPIAPFLSCKVFLYHPTVKLPSANWSDELLKRAHWGDRNSLNRTKSSYRLKSRRQDDMNDCIESRLYYDFYL